MGEGEVKCGGAQGIREIAADYLRQRYHLVIRSIDLEAFRHLMICEIVHNCSAVSCARESYIKS